MLGKSLKTTAVDRPRYAELRIVALLMIRGMNQEDVRSILLHLVVDDHTCSTLGVQQENLLS